MTINRYPAKITKGYIFKLSIPIFFSSLAIPMVGIVDTGLMGHLGNSKYLAATGIATSFISMIFWSFGFLRMGTTGLVSQSLGKGDYREIVMITIRNLTLALIFGLIILEKHDKADDVFIIVLHCDNNNISIIKLLVKSF